MEKYRIYFSIKESEISVDLIVQILRQLLVEPNIDKLFEIENFLDANSSQLKASKYIINHTNQKFNFVLTPSSDYPIGDLIHISDIIPSINIQLQNENYRERLWNTIQKTDSELTPQNLGILSGLSTCQICTLDMESYTQNYIRVSPEFMYSIPATCVESLKHNRLFMRIPNDIVTLTEIEVEQYLRVFNHYRNYLVELGIWKKVILCPGWRETYKEILEEKGLL
jgi:hypothetical protein